MTQVYDSAFFNGTLDDGGTTDLEVLTDQEDVSNVVIMIDDGTPGNNPSTYDLETFIRRDEPDPSDWMFYAEQTGTTSRSWTDPAYPEEMRYTIRNESGNNNVSYRAVLLSFQGEA